MIHNELAWRLLSVPCRLGVHRTARRQRPQDGQWFLICLNRTCNKVLATQWQREDPQLVKS
jgi:hypothetical protein